jgi:outer membrane receptor protein involved in Fe transport
LFAIAQFPLGKAAGTGGETRNRAARSLGEDERRERQKGAYENCMQVALAQDHGSAGRVDISDRTGAAGHRLRGRSGRPRRTAGGCRARGWRGPWRNHRDRHAQRAEHPEGADLHAGAQRRHAGAAAGQGPERLRHAAAVGLVRGPWAWPSDHLFPRIVPAGGNYASAGYYIDDIPITGTGSPDIHAYDLERVEALSGPQGTLYGAGSLAGTIRIITNKPKLGKFEFGAESEVNKYGKGAFGGQIQGYVNLPVTETVAVRAMAYYRRDGGYVDNTPNNGKFNDGRSSTLELGDNNPLTSYTLNNAAIAKKDYNPIYEYGGRLSLLWEPAPGWEVNPQVTAQRQIAYGYFGYDPRVGDLQVHDYDLTRQDDKWVQAQLSIHGHIGDFDVVSATGIFRRNTKLRNDYTYYTVTYDGFGGGYENYLQFFDKAGCTGSGLTLKCSTLINPTQYYHQDNNRNKFTQELRISTPKSWPFDLTIGGFYQSQQQENNNYYAIHGLDQIAGYTKAGAYSSGSGNTTTLAGFGIPTAAGGTMVVSPSAAVKGDGFYITENNQSYHDEAIFAEGHYKIFENLKLTGGIRYFWTDYKIKGFSGVTASALGVGCTVPLPAERLACSNQNPLAADGYGRYKEQGETHKVALDWQVTPTKMIYFNYSTGFRPGGYNRPLRIRARAGCRK